MRIVIDMQGAQTESRFRGIGRYSLSIARAIARQAEAHEVFLALNARFPGSIPSIRQAFEGLIPAERIRIFDVPPSIENSSWLGRASEMIREEFLSSLSPDVVLITSVFEGFQSPAVTSIGAGCHRVPTAAILYDLIPLIYSNEYLPNKALQDYYFKKIEWTKNIDRWLAISESSRREGIAHLKRAGDEVVNISTAISDEFKPAELPPEIWKNLFERIGIKRKYVMYAPGGFDHRKNFERLIHAYSLLPASIRADHQLLIVSKLNSAQRQELVAYQKQYRIDLDELLLPGYVDDEDLIALYSKADLFIFPSLHEGFGLPALEAMACGAVVIGSNRTSIPEVIGRDDAIFDPESVQDMNRKMIQALTDEKFRDAMFVHGRLQSKKFNWSASAAKAIEAMEQLHESANSRRPQSVQNPAVTTLMAGLDRAGHASDQELMFVAQSLAFNQGSARPQLLLDISSLVHSDAKSGIQRVVRSLLSELLSNQPSNFDVQPIWFDAGIYRYAKKYTSSIVNDLQENLKDETVDFAQDDIYLSLDLIMHLTPQVHDFHLDLACRGIKLYFIVYDILLAQHPEWWPTGTDKQFNLWLKSIGQVATGLLCISESVSAEVRDWLQGHQPNRMDSGPSIGSFHLGADLESSLPTTGLPDTAEHVLEQIAARNTFLMVSTIEPRKGYAQALAAFEELWQLGHDINLVIVGKQGWLVDDLVRQLSRHPENRKRLFWLNGISDEYLRLVYQSSNCLIAASQGEGFGLPLIEAAQFKLPIIARDIPVFREVAAEHAFYFKADQPEQLADAIRTWIVLYKNNTHPKSGNMPWLTWKQSAQQLLAAIGLGKPESQTLPTTY